MGDFLVDFINLKLSHQSVFFKYFFDELSLLSQTIISTVIILLTAEFLPKVFFHIYANRLLKLFSLPAYIFYIFFYYVSDFVIWISDYVLRIFFKTKGDQVQLAFSKVELVNYISEQMESVEAEDVMDNEIIIFQNALDFSDKKAREAMIPRTEIKSIEIHDSIENLSKIFTLTGLSKIVVYNNTIDDVLGYVHVFDLFKNPKSIKSILMPTEFVPETMLAKDILNTLTKKRKSLAVVLDEYGGTSGILTIEDIVEELFGEIEDEHDSVVTVEKKISDNSFIFSARLEVDYLNETYKLQLPENENYETLGGLIVYHTENIPEKKQCINIKGFEFTIEEVSSTKIELISLKLLSNNDL